MIKIMNLHTSKPTRPYDVCVDRTSVLGNKFHMKKNEHGRNAVCDDYIDYFDKESMNIINVEFQRALRKLMSLYKKHGQLRLFCWCAPKRCHAETIREYLLEEK